MPALRALNFRAVFEFLSRSYCAEAGWFPFGVVVASLRGGALRAVALRNGVSYVCVGTGSVAVSG